MKILTIFTFLALPFSIITGLFQMNTKNMPLINNQNAWFWIVGFEFLILIIFYLIARKKKWF